MTGDGGKDQKRICPVCDEGVPSGATVCPSCNTDLTLFTTEEMIGVPDDAEALKSQLLSNGNGHVSELLKVAEEEPAAAASDEVEDVGDMFECPECGKLVPTDAAKCPHCGVEFEVEEVFECPLCGAMIDVNVDKCPSCGAEFEDAGPGEAEGPAGPAAEPEAAAPAPPETPEPEKPVTFAERLKSMKEQPPSQKAPAAGGPGKVGVERPMTFAERMKAMKDGKLEGKEMPAAPPVPAEGPGVKGAPAPKPAAVTERKDVDTHTSGKTPAAAPGTGQPRGKKPDAKEGYKELPRYIADVKKLLILANKLDMDISESKQLINKAVAAGKKRDLDNAIRLVKEGKGRLERELRTALSQRIKTLGDALAMEKGAGRDVTVLEKALADARELVNAGAMGEAALAVDGVEKRMAAFAGVAVPKAELEGISRTLETAAALHLNVGEVKKLYDEAKMAADLDDTERMMEMVKQANEKLNRLLPGFIAGEMRKAKVTLREIKMMNVDITKPVDMLKQANEYVKEGDYGSALGAMREFMDFVNSQTR